MLENLISSNTLTTIAVVVYFVFFIPTTFSVWPFWKRWAAENPQIFKPLTRMTLGISALSLLAYLAHVAFNNTISLQARTNCLASPNIRCLSEFVAQVHIDNGSMAEWKLVELSKLLARRGEQQAALQITKVLAADEYQWGDAGEELAYVLAMHHGERDLQVLMSQSPSTYVAAQAMRGAAAGYAASQNFEASESYMDFESSSVFNSPPDVLSLALRNTFNDGDYDTGKAILSWGYKWLINDDDFFWPTSGSVVLDARWSDRTCAGTANDLWFMGPMRQIHHWRDFTTTDPLVWSIMQLAQHEEISFSEVELILKQSESSWQRFIGFSGFASHLPFGASLDEQRVSALRMASSQAAELSRYEEVVVAHVGLSLLYAKSGLLSDAQNHALFAAEVMFSKDNYQFWHSATPHVSSVLMASRSHESFREITKIVTDEDLLSQIFSCAIYSSLILEQRENFGTLFDVIYSTSNRYWANKVLNLYEASDHIDELKLFCRSSTEFNLCSSSDDEVCPDISSRQCERASEEIALAISIEKSEETSELISTHLGKATKLLSDGAEWQSLFSDAQLPDQYVPSESFLDFIQGLADQYQERDAIGLIKIRIKDAVERHLREQNSDEDEVPTDKHDEFFPFKRSSVSEGISSSDLALRASKDYGRAEVDERIDEIIQVIIDNLAASQ